MTAIFFLIFTITIDEYNSICAPDDDSETQQDYVSKKFFVCPFSTRHRRHRLFFYLLILSQQCMV